MPENINEIATENDSSILKKFGNASMIKESARVSLSYYKNRFISIQK